METQSSKKSRRKSSIPNNPIAIEPLFLLRVGSISPTVLESINPCIWYNKVVFIYFGTNLYSFNIMRIAKDNKNIFQKFDKYISKKLGIKMTLNMP